jgi:hypothetical protein
MRWKHQVVRIVKYINFSVCALSLQAELQTKIHKNLSLRRHYNFPEIVYLSVCVLCLVLQWNVIVMINNNIEEYTTNEETSCSIFNGHYFNN